MKTKVSALFCIGLACSILLLPLDWIMAAILSAVWHELCHFAAIRLFTKEDTGIHIFSFGARIRLPSMSGGREMICALAGPLGGFTLLLFARWMPRTAVCAAFQSLYNLLPLYPLDGGRALACALTMVFSPPKAKRIQIFVERFCILLILLLGIYVSVVYRIGPLPLFLCGILLLRVKIVKMPCKVSNLRVQ